MKPRTPLSRCGRFSAGTSAIASALALSIALAPVGAVGAAEVLPDGFLFEQVGYGPFNGWGPSAFAFLPDGRMLMLELWSGGVRLNAQGATSSALVHTIPDVWFDGERGFLGVAVDPGWPARPYLYFFYSHTSSFSHVIMLTASGDLTDPMSTSMTLGSRYDLLTDLPDNSFIHNGGTLRFGPDEMLYVSLGDDAVGCNSQDLSVMAGEILRLDVSGMPGQGGGPPAKADITPSGNPYVVLGDNAGLVWAWGLRNPFRFTIDGPTGDLYIGDVGTGTWEEVDVVAFGGGGGENFAWPQLEGPDSTGNPSTCGQENTVTAPAYVYPHQNATSIIAGPLYHPAPASPLSFPASYDGSLFIMEHFAGWIRRLVDTGSGFELAPVVPGQPSSENWAEGFAFYSDFQLGPDGALYMSHLHSQSATPPGVFRIANATATNARELSSNPSAAVVVFPNPTPVGAGASFRWNVTDSGRQSLRIVDGVGRTVRSTAFRADAPTEAVIRWDGRNAAGSRVAAGVYFYRIEDSKGHVLGGKLTIVR